MEHVLTREIVVDDDINTLDIDSSPEKVSGYEDTVLEVLEILITLKPVAK